MSLLNQVLNDLEKRGVALPPAGEAVRAVSAPKETDWLKILGAGALIALLALLGWRGLHSEHSEMAAPPPEFSEQLAEIDPASKLSFELATPPASESGREKKAPKRRLVEKTPPPADGVPALPLQAGALEQTAAQANSGVIDKQFKTLTPAQHAENEFRKANELLQQGQLNPAIAGYEAALRYDATHVNARQALAGTLLKSKRSADAEQVLQEGLAANRALVSFAMIVARLQVDRNETALALETLQSSARFAEKQADYQAFMAALMQRLGEHREAVAHYQAALRLQPDAGVWLMGLGISLQATQQIEAARAAYKHALSGRQLSKELQTFVAQKLKELGDPAPGGGS